MGRNRLPEGELKKPLILRIEEKFLSNQDQEILKEIGYKAIVKHVKKNQNK